MDILVTGFQPFLGEKINPSQKLALDLQATANVRSLILPVEFKKSFEILKEELLRKKPDYLIMLGQASGRKNICFEKIGLNWVQTAHADEGGAVPPRGAIDSTKPLALMSVFPVDEVYEALKKQGHPVEISFSAGAFVCNDLYFRILSEFALLKAVFVHVPLISEQAKPGDDRPVMAYAAQLSTIESAIRNLRQSI